MKFNKKVVKLDLKILKFLDCQIGIRRRATEKTSADKRMTCVDKSR